MKSNTATPTDRRQAAQELIDEGWAIVPIPKSEKGPRVAEWPTKTFAATDVSPDGNIGVKCGEKSGHRVDVDLDCDEAIRLAPKMLPPTGRIHGRTSKPGSHHWYEAEGVTSEEFKHVGGGVIVELRSDGAQTVVPPSVHPSGEDVRWEKDGEAAPITAEALRRAVAMLATTVLVAEHWPADGSRHDTALALAGFLAKRGLDRDQIECILDRVAELANDNEARDRLGAVRSTVAKHERGEPVTSETALAELMGTKVVDRLRQWLSDGDFVRGKGDAVIANNQANVRRALERLDVALSHNLLTNQLLANGQPLDDAIADRRWLEIDERFHFRPTFPFFETVLKDTARQRPFHPVREYLNSVTWDGTPRLDRWLISYGGAADTPLNRAVGALVLSC